MTKKTKEFIKLQNEWYAKLKREGFEDIEFYNPKTGGGQSSPYMRTERIPDTGQLRAVYSTELANHYRLCRNFLAHGPFYPNLKDKYLKLHENAAFCSVSAAKAKEFNSFKKYFESLELAYTKAESACWEHYTNGMTLRENSNALRRLHWQKKLGKPPKRWGKATKGKPYSIFWVKSTIDRLKIDSIRFNATNSEGIDLWSEESTENPENSST